MSAPMALPSPQGFHREFVQRSRESRWRWLSLFGVLWDILVTEAEMEAGVRTEFRGFSGEVGVCRGPVEETWLGIRKSRLLIVASVSFQQGHLINYLTGSPVE